MAYSKEGSLLIALLNESDMKSYENKVFLLIQIIIDCLSPSEWQTFLLWLFLAAVLEGDSI